MAAALSAATRSRSTSSAYYTYTQKKGGGNGNGGGAAANKKEARKNKDFCECQIFVDICVCHIFVVADIDFLVGEIIAARYSWVLDTCAWHYCHVWDFSHSQNRNATKTHAEILPLCSHPRQKKIPRKENTKAHYLDPFRLRRVPFGLLRLACGQLEAPRFLRLVALAAVASLRVWARVGVYGGVKGVKE
jgi:hypothetical protein